MGGLPKPDLLNRQMPGPIPLCRQMPPYVVRSAHPRHIQEFNVDSPGEDEVTFALSLCGQSLSLSGHI